MACRVGLVRQRRREPAPGVSRRVVGGGDVARLEEASVRRDAADPGDDIFLPVQTLVM